MEVDGNTLVYSTNTSRSDEKDDEVKEKQKGRDNI